MKNLSRVSFVPKFAALGLFVLAMQPTVQAATTYYWNTADGAYTTGSNWSDNAISGGTTGVVPTATDSVVFNQSSVNGPQIIATGGAFTTAGMTFANTGTTALTTVADIALTLGSGGLTINSGAGAVTFGTTTTGQKITFILGASQAWTNNSATALTLNTSNAIALGGNTLTLGGTGNILTGTTTGASISGTGAIIKTGTGTVTLGAPNTTFTGTVTIKEGQLNVGNTPSALGVAGNVVTLGDAVVGANATLNALNSQTYPQAITVASGAGTRTISNSVGGATFSGAVTLNKAVILSNIVGSQTLTFSGGFTGTGDITIANTLGRLNVSTTAIATTGDLIFSNVSNAVTTVSAGVNNIGAMNNNSGVTSTGTVTVTGAVNNTGAINNNATGSGVFTITGGIGTNVTGITQASSTSALAITTNPIALGGDRDLTSSGTAAFTISGGVTGAHNLALKANNTGGITISGAAGVNNGGSITNSGTGAGIATISGVIGANVTGITQNSATSPLTITGANLFTSGVAIKSGTLNVGINDPALGAGGGGNVITLGDSVLGANATLNSTTSSRIYAQPIIVASGAGSRTISATIGATASTFSGAITLGKDLTVDLAQPLILSGIIDDGVSNFSITKQGVGTLTLRGANTFTGGILIKEGTVSAGISSSALGAGGANNIITLGDGTTVTGATLNSTGGLTIAQPINVAAGAGTRSITTSGAPTYSGAVTLSNNLTISNSDSASTTTFSGNFTGTGNVSLNGASTNSIVLLSGSITHTGDIIFASTTALGRTNLSGSINNVGAIINTSLGNGSSISGVIGTSVTGITQNSATSALTLTADNLFTGTTTITAGTVNVGNGGAAGSIIGDVVNNGALVFNRSGTLSYGGAISGSGPVTKSGSGVVTFNGTNIYSGATTVSAGTLAVGAAGTINSSSAVNVGAAGAKFIYNNSTTALSPAVTLSGVSLASRSILGGSGTIGSALLLDNIGDTLSPGNSPGVMSFNVSQTWDSFSYDWEINNFVGTTAGTDFDKISITGSLSLSGLSYQLNLLSLTAGNVAGFVGGFVDTNQSWIILTSTTGISGFNPSNWALNESGFTSSPSYPGTFSLSQIGNDIVLQYTAVPEPSTTGLAVVALGALAIYCRKRRARRAN